MTRPVLRQRGTRLRDCVISIGVSFGMALLSQEEDAGSRHSLLLERAALGVGRNRTADQDEDAFDESPEAANAKSADRYGDLRNADADVAKVKSVDAEVTDENPQQSSHELRFPKVFLHEGGRGIRRREAARELGVYPERFPIRRAFHLREGLRVGAAFGDP